MATDTQPETADADATLGAALGRRSETARERAETLVPESGTASTHLALVGLIALMASPLVFALLMSTQTVAQVYDVSYLGVGDAGASKYAEVLTDYGLWRYMLNSFVMSVVVVVGKLGISLLAAMALVYYEFPYKNAVFFLVLFTLMFPVPVRIVPLFELMVDMGWANTILALTGPYLASATAVFLLRQHFQSIPTTIVETARLDGVGPLTFLRRVLVPMSRGMLTGLAVITFIYSWNQYLWPLIVISDQPKQVVQVGMKYLQSVGTAGQTDWALIMAGAVLTLLPPLAVLIAFRRPLLETLGVQ